MSMNVDSSDFFVNLVSNTGRISIAPSAYGRSTCCCGVSGAGNGSMREATMTLLVDRSPFQKSGTTIVCFRNEVFGAGAFLGGFSAVGSFAMTNTSYVPAATVNEREMRIGFWPAATGTKLMSSYA